MTGDEFPDPFDVLRLRFGRKVGRTVYRQVGDVPGDGDELIGMMDTRELAGIVVEAVNGLTDCDPGRGLHRMQWDRCSCGLLFAVPRPESVTPLQVEDWSSYCDCHDDGRDHRIEKLEVAFSQVMRAVKRRTEQRDAYARTCYEVEQILGKALGYPEYGPNGPGNSDAVDVGEQVPESLAAEVAARLGKLRDRDG